MSEPIPSNDLFALSYHVGARCDAQNRAYVWCKKYSENPEACLEKGAAVTQCVQQLFKDVVAKGPKEYKEYSKCLDYYTLDVKKCADEKQAFEKAVPVEAFKPKKIQT